LYQSAPKLQAQNFPFPALASVGLHTLPTPQAGSPMPLP